MSGLSSFEFITGVFLISLLVGSFLNVLIYRLPRMMLRENTESVSAYLYECFYMKKNIGVRILDEGCPDCDHQLSLKDLELFPESQLTFNLFYPPSSCPDCGHRIRFYENIPLVSYCLILFGKCSACKASISFRYPLVELSTAILSATLAWYFGVGILSCALIFLAWGMIAAALIDYDHQLLPDCLTQPLMWIGILLANFGYLQGLQVDISASILGATLGYASLWSVYFGFKLLCKKEGMGHGDFKLLACLGAWLGVSSLPLIILFSSILGSLVGIIAIIFCKQSTQKSIPFGPYLAIAALITLFFGPRLNQFWLGI